MKEKNNKNMSPCLRCTRVANPQNCENKRCTVWQKWFLQQWAVIHAYPRRREELASLRPVGVSLGGRVYALPHQTGKFLQTDPCRDCICTEDVCQEPCRMRKLWERARREALL